MKYIPGTQMFIADFFIEVSNHCGREHHEEACVFYQELEDVQLEEDIKISTDGLEEVRNYTKDDEALLQLG